MTIARILADSEFGAEELDRIFFQEVHPVCCWNMRSPAGEWVEFDRDWLIRRIEENLAKQPATGWLRRKQEQRENAETKGLEQWILPAWTRTKALL